MSLKRKATTSSGGDFEKAPAGTFPAVCVAVIGTGTHNESFPGQPPKDTEKLFLCWELLGEPMPGSKFNHVIGREYTLSLHTKATLRRLLDGWRGKPLGEDEEFDFAKLLNQPCLLTVVHTEPNADGKSYANVSGVARPMKGQTFDKPMRKGVLVDEIDAASVKTVEALDWLPRVYGQPLHERMKDSKEWKGIGGNRGDSPADDQGDAAEPAGVGSDADDTTIF